MNPLPPGPRYLVEVPDIYEFTVPLEKAMRAIDDGSDRLSIHHPRALSSMVAAAEPEQWYESLDQQGHGTSPDPPIPFVDGKVIYRINLILR